MHRSFGMETAPRALRWEEQMKGPPVEDVLRHVAKVGNYRDIFTSRPARA